MTAAAKAEASATRTESPQTHAAPQKPLHRNEKEINEEFDEISHEAEEQGNTSAGNVTAYAKANALQEHELEEN